MTSGRKTLKKIQKSRPKKRNSKRKRKEFSFRRHIIYPILLISILFAIWHYRYALYYLAFQSIDDDESIKVSSLTTQLRIYDVLQHHKDKTYGIDVSHYQGKIDWDKVAKIQDSFPITFVFVRATAGKTRVDRQFKKNWKKAGANRFVRGAYHYYRPNENSILQADNFIRTVKLRKGDLPPVLDIEDIPRVQSIDSLKLGLKRWLKRVEDHYGVKPIIYSGESFYNDHLYKDFSAYTCWIANYNYYVENIDDDWQFWQFTDKGSVRGIKEYVDINIFNGGKEEINSLCIKN